LRRESRASNKGQRIKENSRPLSRSESINSRRGYGVNIANTTRPTIQNDRAEVISTQVAK
jgi:hypothetical protein